MRREHVTGVVIPLFQIAVKPAELTQGLSNIVPKQQQYLDSLF
jgi:hypothetical protein